MVEDCGLCVRFFLNHIVQEIRCLDGLNRFNHCSPFPHFMTHVTLLRNMNAPLPDGGVCFIQKKKPNIDVLSRWSG